MSLSRQQFTLLGIFALFLGPVILVILMRSSWWQYQPAGMKNHGHLVQPPVHLALEQAAGVDGKWLILYVLEQACDEQCIEDVTALRQIHRATGRNREHLAIVLLSQTSAEPTTRSKLESIYPEFHLLTDSSSTALTTLASVNRKVSDIPSDSGSIHTYVLDPMQNIILAYGASTRPNEMHKDLKRLLKWSDQEKTQ